MKDLIRLVASAAFSLMLLSGITLTFSGCSADSLSGPSFDAAATGGGTGGGTDGGGSEHNLDKGENGTGGGTDGGGSEHNLDG